MRTSSVNISRLEGFWIREELECDLNIGLQEDLLGRQSAEAGTPQSQFALRRRVSIEASFLILECKSFIPELSTTVPGGS